MIVKNGRFGPYVTDGETNASLRSSDDVETLTDERAAELMAGPPRTRPGEAAAASSDQPVMPGPHLGEARVAGFVHTARRQSPSRGHRALPWGGPTRAAAHGDVRARGQAPGKKRA